MMDDIIEDIHAQQKLSEHYNQQQAHEQNQMPSKKHQLDLHYQCRRKQGHFLSSKIYLNIDENIK